MPKRKKCAIYARYSSCNQREASIDDQIRKCREAAAAKGWEVLEEHIYFDKAHSGTRMQSRDGFKALMRVAMSDDCPFQQILVDDTSRIARNTKEALDIFSLLSFYGVYVYYVSQGIDTSQETAEEMITINGLIDSLYIRNLSKETHRGIVGQILKGYNGGARRYGYRSEPVYNGKVDIYGNPEAAGYVLKINPDEANTIIRVFKLFGEEGYSAKGIANLLNKELIKTGGPKPPRGKFWCMSTILGSKKAFRGILNNELYIGKYYWNRSLTKRNPENGKKKWITKNKNLWLIVNKPELRIIPDSLWEKAKKRQRQLKDITKGKYMKARLAYSVNLITGLVTCSQCGGNIVVVSGGQYAKYGCSSNWNKGASVCTNDTKITKKDFHKLILEALHIDLDKEEILSYLVERTAAFIKEKLSVDDQKWKGEAVETQLKRVNKEISNFINAIKAGIITDTVKRQLSSAEKKKKELEKLLNDSQKKMSKLPYISIAPAREYVTNLQSTLELYPVLGRTFLSKIIEKIVIAPLGNSIIIDIHCKKDGILNGKHISVPLAEKDSNKDTRINLREKAA